MSPTATQQIVLGDQGFSLPVDAMTEAIAMLATRGRGKTHTATVVAEELLRLNQQIVILDPVGVYWGLRSSKDGKAVGFPIPILGGSHSDLPLAVADAATVTRFIVEKETSVIVDLSQFTKGEQVRFCEVFFEQLWSLKAKYVSPMLLVLEEAQEFAPQRPREKEAVMLGRIERIAKLGRNRGIGLLAITQRPASLNKDVLDLAGILIVLGMIAPIEKRVVRDWISGHDLDYDLVETLPSLPKGDAWVWWPLENVIKRIHVRERYTFDSSATPKAGRRLLDPSGRAVIDVDAFRDQLGALIQKAKAEDPAALRRRIAELERELLNQQQLAPKVEIREKKIEVPTVPAALITELRVSGLDLEKAGAKFIELGKKLGLIGAEYGKFSPELTRGYRTSLAIEAGKANKLKWPKDGAGHDLSGDRLPRPEAVRKPRGDTANGSISKAQQQILDAAAFLESLGIMQPDVVQLALLARQSSGGGYWRSNIGRLRSMGLMERTSLTPAGRALAEAPTISTTQELQDHVMSLLSGAQRAILQTLIDVYPNALDAEDVARKANMEPSGGYWRSNVGRLRTLQLITKKGPMAALPVLFIE